MFTPVSERCPDCHGSGYSHNDFDLCSCMAGHRPAYDLDRKDSEEFSTVFTWSPAAPDGMAEVWNTCGCGIGAVNANVRTRVPWVPDCSRCNDTGYEFAYHTPNHTIYSW